MVKTHSLLHIEDGVSTGLTLFSRFHPSECRREVKKKKKKKTTKNKGGGQKEICVGTFSSSGLQDGVHRSRLRPGKSGWVAFVDVWESVGSRVITCIAPTVLEVNSL